jgi:uncharacterized protein YcgI (DUF1989 family)
MQGFSCEAQHCLDAMRRRPFMRLCMPAGRLSVSVRAAATLEALKPKTDLILIPGGKGKAVHMKKGDTIKIINTHGAQARAALPFCYPIPSGSALSAACCMHDEPCEGAM